MHNEFALEKYFFYKYFVEARVESAEGKEARPVEKKGKRKNNETKEQTNRKRSKNNTKR